MLDDLRARLRATRWPEPGPGAEWEAGASLPYLRELCATWADEYDWRPAEARLNADPHYLCEVDGVDLHFWHIRGVGPRPFPLLMIHGWPGSVAEFASVIGPLTDPAAHGGAPEDAFDLVLPELPGFGFGGRPRAPGWGTERTARAFDALMTGELGYARYGAQGGDWGARVSGLLGANHSDHVAGVHINLPYGMAPEPGSEEDHRIAAELGERLALERGYSLIQRTKPDSLTVAQTDSPAGLAAWIVEKFRAWSDCGGEVERSFTRETLLTNLMFYWVNGSVASAARIYREVRMERGSRFGHERVTVPTGCAAFPAEPFGVPRSWVEPHFNIAHWTDMPRGGHFAALEEPNLLIDDVRAFFRLVR